MEFEPGGVCSRSQTVPDLAALAPVPPSPCLSLNPPSPLSASRYTHLDHCPQMLQISTCNVTLNSIWCICRPLSPDSCASSSQNEKLTSDFPLVFQEEASPDREAKINLETPSKKMAMLNLEEGSTPRSAAHMAMLNLEDSSLICRVSSLEERCKEQEEEVAELKAGLANALNRIARLEGEKKHSFQVLFF